MPHRPSDSFIVYGLRETYAELGDHEFKVVLDPARFKSSHLSTLDIVDSDGQPIQHEVRRWGRKMNCVFSVRETTADGVASVRMVLRDERGFAVSPHLTFWVIK